MKLTLIATVTNDKSSSPRPGIALAAAAAILVGTGIAHADTSTEVAAPSAVAEPGADSPQEVVVTGTRQSGVKALDSAAPIQILSPAALQAASGNPDLMQALAQLVPALTAQPFAYGYSNTTLLARLRGMSPNHVLVLIDGKRRHTTANLDTISGPYDGGAGADLSLIPMSAIDHIEVLTEGAAAQYGSDAISGVINIILKKDSSGAQISAQYGADFDSGPNGASLPFSSDGSTNATTFHAGFEPVDGAFFNVTGEIHNHDRTFRGAEDPRTTSATNLATAPDSNMPNAPGYPYLNWIEGDASAHSLLSSFNAGYDFGGGTEFYAFGTYSNKTGSSYQNYRLPTVYSYTDPEGDTTYPLPLGFEPLVADNEVDYATTLGVKGLLGDWNWDLSSTWGADRHHLYTLASVNVDQYATTGEPTPTNYYDGSLLATQWTTTLDVNRDFDVGMAGPLNTAFGVEFRRDGYQVNAGQPQSYLDGGAASNAGFAPVDAGYHARSNGAAYIDLAGKPIEATTIDAAVRYEHYSDFGSATVGKLSARYDFTPELGVRATISNGFRAPTLAEEYYSSTSTGPSSVFAELPPNGPAASILGLGDLKPEKSNNLSVGLVYQPEPGMSMTLDGYHIRVTNRIVGTGYLFGSLNGEEISPLINSVLSAAGTAVTPQDALTGVFLFANGVSTTTNGADFTFNYPVDYSFGHIDWSVSATYDDTAVTHINAEPAAVAEGALGSPLYNLQTISDLTTASPKEVVNLGAHWTLGRVSVNLLEKIYGKTSEWESDSGDNAENKTTWYKTTLGVTPITNASLSYQFSTHLKATVGANNAFNRFPSRINPQLLAAYSSQYAVQNNNPSAAAPYPTFSPFGIDGGFYYIQANYAF
jgi:iron complex outermembrane receptor protein